MNSDLTLKEKKDFQATIKRKKCLDDKTNLKDDES
jgi:hypothetical protein